jgi:hypothetical protein
MLIEVKTENGSVLLNTDKILSIEPTRTSHNWNCCSMRLEDNTSVLCVDSYEEIKSKIQKMMILPSGFGN